MTTADPAPSPPGPAEPPEGADGSGPRAVEASAAYLFARLEIVEGRVRTLIRHRRGDNPAPEDPFRGLYLSDDYVDLMLANGPISRVIDWEDAEEVASLAAQAEEVVAAGTEIRLWDLSRRVGLDELDEDLLLVALAPDLDVRFERLYGYLNDDVTRRRATVGLSLELAGMSPWSAAARSRLYSDSPLVASGLVHVDEPDRPYLSRSVRVPDRVAAYLLGDDGPDPGVSDLLRVTPNLVDTPLVSSLAGVLRSGIHFFYIREKAGASASAAASSALARTGMRALTVDLEHLDPGEDLVTTTRLLRREAVLQGAGLVIGPIDLILDRDQTAIRALTALAEPTPSSGAQAGSMASVPVFLRGRSGWEPAWSTQVPLVAEARTDSTGERITNWEGFLGDQADTALAASDVTTQFLLSAEQVRRAVEAARLQAGLAGEEIGDTHLRAGARAQNGAGLERLARRIPPGVGWDDLVLAPVTEAALRELAGRARRRDVVLDQWGMRPGGGRGRGITVLFAGDSGTGKTMSAEVVAGDLGLDLYTVNLATVVDKYVGETEKNLERIFTEADGVNAVLLFDEADALFGKRSEVKDANDRYANIEVAYLLQRMETFDGIAILATNLRANVDDAFSRRLDMIVDFPTPDPVLRRALWDRCLAPGVPRGDDLDLDFCAKAFELSGGNIRSIAITAAYLAADSGRSVSMRDLVLAIQQEYRKLGRLVVADEFGPYYPLIGAI